MTLELCSLRPHSKLSFFSITAREQQVYFLQLVSLKMAPRTRSSMRGAPSSFEQLPPRTRKASASSASSSSEREDAPALTKKRSLRRLMTIELPAAQLKANEPARQVETAKTIPPPTTAVSPPPATPPTPGATATPPPAATPRPWGFGSFFTSVRRILSPFPPSQRLLSPIKEETPRRVQARQAPSPSPPSNLPAPVSMARKRQSSDDIISTPKRVKQTPTRRSAKTVREQRDIAAKDALQLPDVPYIPSTRHTPLTFSVPEEDDDSQEDVALSSPTKAPLASTPKPITTTAQTGSPAKPMESTASPEPAQEASKKRKRVKIDDLKYIPSRRAGQSTGTFALLDEFFVEDDDSVEVDESQVELLSERPSKRTRTGNNVFDMTSPEKTAPAPASTSPTKRTRSISPTKRSRHASPEKSSFLGTPSTLADKIQTPVKVQFASPDKSQAQPLTPMDMSTPHHFTDAFGTPDSAKMQSIKKTTPSAVFSPMDTTSPPTAETIVHSSMDTTVSPQKQQSQNTTSDFYPASTSPDSNVFDAPQGPNQQLNALQRKRSEAEKYKPQKSSRLKEMQRLSSTSTLLESPQHGVILEESTSPTDTPPEYLLEGQTQAPLMSTTPTTTPPSFLGFDAHSATPITSNAGSFTPKDTPLAGNFFKAPGASPLTKQPVSSTPADMPPDRPIFTPAAQTSYTPTTGAHTPLDTPPDGAIYTPAPMSSYTPATVSFTPLDDTPDGPIYTPATVSFTPLGTPPDRPITTPEPGTSYTPATVSFTPLDTPPDRPITTPAATSYTPTGTPPTSPIVFPAVAAMTSHLSRGASDLIDGPETDMQIAAAAQTFSAGVKDFGIFHPLAVA